MTNLFRAAALAGMAAMALASYAEASTLKKGTMVMLAFDQAINSRQAKSGDKVKMHVASDIKAGDRTVIRAGTPVIGVISEVSKRDHFGKNAKIRLTMNPVRAIDGTMVALEPRQKGKEFKGSKTDQAALVSGGGALILGPVGLVGGYFVTGKSVYIKVGDKIESQVSGDTHIR